ncbi:MAG TPA: 2-C-methyl-D-erythritol 4-phosphate cytidylyltransferase [Jiangellaceae bacterium]
MAIGLIVPAAGRGERLGAGVPKALLPLAGLPLLVHAIRGALASRVVDVVVVAAPADRVDEVRGLLAGEVTELRVVIGGADRRESVARALAELPPEVDTVLVHDAARCLTPPAVFAAVAAALAGGAAAVVPAVPVADTVKQVAHGVVAGTPDRDTLRAVQTPQGFRRDVLEQAHASEPGAVTDDAGLVERLGFAVSVVAGHDEAFKITRSLDLVLAEAILARRARAGAP